MLGALDCAMIWGARHRGHVAPLSKPDQMARPTGPVIALFIQDKVPHDDVRKDFDFQMCKRHEGATWIIKTGEPAIRVFLTGEGIEFLELDTNRAYWGPLASEWRNAEMRYYADVVLEFNNPSKPKKQRKGRKVE